MDTEGLINLNGSVTMKRLPQGRYTSDVLFALPFDGVSFSQGIVQNWELGFRKGSTTALMRNPRCSWRKFLLGLVSVAVRFLDVLICPTCIPQMDLHYLNVEVAPGKGV